MQRKIYLSEAEQRALNYNIFIPAFVHHSIKYKKDEIPPDVVECIKKWTAPVTITNGAADPVNFISDIDILTSNKYKFEGNEYFKQKEYECAIIKYTSALNHNPNNYILYANQSYCLYLLQEYKLAIHGVTTSLDSNPSWIKGWYRYALILNKLKKWPMAAVAFHTAYALDIDFQFDTNQNIKNNVYGKEYIALLKTMKQKKRKKDIKFVKEHIGRINVQRLRAEMIERDRLASAISNGSTESDKEQVQFIKNKMNFRVHLERARCDYFIKTKAFKSLGNGPKGRWRVECLGTSEIWYNKRRFAITVSAQNGQKQIDHVHFYGVPTAKIVLSRLYQIMTFARFWIIGCVKPSVVTFSCHFKDFFDELVKELSRFDIICKLDIHRERNSGTLHMREWT